MDWSRNKEARGCLCVRLEAVCRGLGGAPVLCLMSRGVQVHDIWTWRALRLQQLVWQPRDAVVQDIVDRVELEEVARNSLVEGESLALVVSSQTETQSS